MAGTTAETLASSKIKTMNALQIHRPERKLCKQQIAPQRLVRRPSTAEAPTAAAKSVENATHNIPAEPLFRTSCVCEFITDWQLPNED